MGSSMNVNPEIIAGLKCNIKTWTEFVSGYGPVLGCYETGSCFACCIKCVEFLH